MVSGPTDDMPRLIALLHSDLQLMGDWLQRITDPMQHPSAEGLILHNSSSNVQAGGAMKRPFHELWATAPTDNTALRKTKIWLRVRQFQPIKTSWTGIWSFFLLLHTKIKCVCMHACRREWKGKCRPQRRSSTHYENWEEWSLWSHLEGNNGTGLLIAGHDLTHTRKNQMRGYQLNIFLWYCWNFRLSF